MGRGFESLPRYHPNVQTILVNASKAPVSRGFSLYGGRERSGEVPLLPHINVGLMWG